MRKKVLADELKAGLASKDPKQSVFLANLSFYILNFSKTDSTDFVYR